MPIIRNHNARIIKFEAVLDFGGLSGTIYGSIAYGTLKPEFFVDVSNGIVQKLIENQDERLFAILDDVQQEMEQALKEQISNDEREIADSQQQNSIPRIVLKDKPGYIYLVKASDYYKIGLSKQPKVRFSQIGLQLPFPYEVLHLISATNMYEAESKLHQKYAHQRLNGEWFSLTENEVAEIRSIEKM
jgi:hypothetical protein